MDGPRFGKTGSRTTGANIFREGMVGGVAGPTGRREAAPSRPGGRSVEALEELVRAASSSDSVKKELGARLGSCPLCKWILEDITENGTLTGHPKDYARADLFPREAKIRHLELEGIPLTKAVS